MSSPFDARPRVKDVLPENPEGGDMHGAVKMGRFPSWLHRKLPKGGGLWQTDRAIGDNRLHTVCEEARCPNLLECWSKKTATFLVMGKACTRACGFCDIETSKNPPPLEEDEPARIVDSVQKLGLKHVVITMVARDDLCDGGGAHLVAIQRAMKAACPDTTLELLTSDLNGNWEALKAVLAEEPLVFNHNVETVRELTPRVRHKATYERSLELLNRAHKLGKQKYLKSGIMVGLGETQEQVHECLRDLQKAGCNVVTMGQYLQPNKRKLRVKRFVTPEEFKGYEEYGHSIGIKRMHCGPFVRSSYNAGLLVDE